MQGRKDCGPGWLRCPADPGFWNSALTCDRGLAETATISIETKGFSNIPGACTARVGPASFLVVPSGAYSTHGAPFRTIEAFPCGEEETIGVMIRIRPRRRFKANPCHD